MKFVYGSEEGFYNFFNGLKKNDNIAVLGHDDLDGIVSVVMMKHILDSKGLKVGYVDFLTLKPGMFTRKIDELKSKNITKVFILDVAADTVDFEGLVELNKVFDVFLLDHHPINPKIKGFDKILKVSDGFCIGYVLFKFGGQICPMNDFHFLACATVISDVSYANSKECFDFVKKSYPDFVSERALEIEPGKFAHLVSLATIYFKDNLNKIYEFILENRTDELKKHAQIIEKEIDYWASKFKQEAEFYPEKKLYIYYFNPKYNLSSILSTKLSFMNLSYTIILLSNLNGDTNHIRINGRSNGGVYDLNALFKKSIVGLDDAIAGGHTRASGGRILRKDLEKFKQNLLKNLS